MCREVTQAFPCEVWSPNLARRFCADQLAGTLVAGAQLDAVTEDIVIIASELVTNSVNAGCARIRMTLTIHHGFLRLAVGDDAPGEPQLRRAQPHDSQGRGLAITGVLARAWGVESAGEGKQVWAELPLPGGLTHGLDCRV
jgi:anti-sigma regulatory factor (Ser/Thr protein kinase)